MKKPIEHEFVSHVAYTRELEKYCDFLAESLIDSLEQAAMLCEQSDRYRGDYFAAIIRKQKDVTKP